MLPEKSRNDERIASDLSSLRGRNDRSNLYVIARKWQNFDFLLTFHFRSNLSTFYSNHTDCFDFEFVKKKKPYEKVSQ